MLTRSQRNLPYVIRPPPLRSQSRIRRDVEVEGSPPENPPSKYFFLSQRCILCILCCFAVCISHGSRNITAVAFILEANLSKPIDDSACPFDENDLKEPLPSIFRKVSDWNYFYQGVLESSFYWSYVVTLVPSGLIADQYGGKHVLTGSMFGSSLTLILIPPVVSNMKKKMFESVLGLRILNGLCQGGVAPAINALLAQWAPLNSRTTMVCFIFATEPLGTVIYRLLGPWIIHRAKTWASIFYLFGGLGLLWCVFWQIFCYSTPDEHPWISHKEKNSIMDSLEEHVLHVRKSVPCRRIFMSGPIWALIVNEVGNVWAFHFLVKRIPEYLREILQFHDEYWTVTSVLLASLLGVMLGCISDWLIYEKHVNITVVRKICTVTAALGCALFLLLGSMAACDRLMAMSCFSIALCLIGFYYAGAEVNILDLAPNFAGTIMGIVTGVGSTMAIFSPLFVQVLTPDNTFNQWRNVFWFTFFLLGFGGLSFLIFGSAHERVWNNPV